MQLLSNIMLPPTTQPAMVQLTLVMLEGNSVCWDIAPMDTVADLKRRVVVRRALEGVPELPLEDMRILCGGRQLEDEEPLLPESFLHVVGSLPGGGKRARDAVAAEVRVRFEDATRACAELRTTDPSMAAMRQFVDGLERDVRGGADLVRGRANELEAPQLRRVAAVLGGDERPPAKVLALVQELFPLETQILNDYQDAIQKIRLGLYAALDQSITNLYWDEPRGRRAFERVGETVQDVLRQRNLQDARDAGFAEGAALQRQARAGPAVQVVGDVLMAPRDV